MTISEQRWAIVTGGNRGLGLETCRQLAQQGYGVLLTARDLAQAERAATELAAVGVVQAAQLDVANEASVSAFAVRVRQQPGQVHALVNNAGISMSLPASYWCLRWLYKAKAPDGNRGLSAFYLARRSCGSRAHSC